MPARLLPILVLVLIASGASMAQEPERKLTRVTGLDDKPFPVDVSRRGGQPEVRGNGSPYFLGGDQYTEDPPVWFINSGKVSPVLGYKRGGAKRVGLEIVESGGGWFLTYVRDGVNEFWKLNGAEAEPVRLKTGKTFAMRARITRGGARTFLYDTDYEGRNSFYEIKGTTAEPMVITDRANHGGASYAWWLETRLLVAFYQAGTYDFYWLQDGVFTPCWERNGAEKYDEQVDSIEAAKGGGRWYFIVTRNDKSKHIWTPDGDRLAGVKLDAPTGWAGNDHGLYVIAGKGLQVSLIAGTGVTPLKLGESPLVADRISARGTTALAGDTLIEGSTPTKLSAGSYLLVADKLVEADGKLMRVAGGKLEPANISGGPEDFGRVHSSWTVGTRTYVVERPEGDLLAFRLWLLE